jgi:hypothetical protein
MGNQLTLWCYDQVQSMSKVQKGPKVTSLVAHSSRGRCAQHLRRIRGCDARIRRESGACMYITRGSRVRCASCSPRISCKCCAHLPREERTLNKGMLLLDPALYIVTFLLFCGHSSGGGDVLINATCTCTCTPMI